MALTYGKQFASQELSDSASALFTLDSGNIRNMTILLVNDTGSAVTVTGHVVPSGGSVANSNIFMDATSLAASERLEVNIPQISSGDSLQMFASAASSITAHDLDSLVRT